ncbi:MAG: BLUF domain-containing protein [Alphaproteobacteria bacterium]|nr:BLUF domain-containing protein [Alphaproteobacteria bacterium]
MSNPVLQIAYVSTADHPMGMAELDALLVESRNFNRDHAIIGMLLYMGGNFRQGIEEPEDEVDALMARIRRDSRHKEVRELIRAPANGREFGAWSMAFLRTADADKAPRAYAVGAQVRRALKDAARVMGSLLGGFAARNARRASVHDEEPGAALGARAVRRVVFRHLIGHARFHHEGPAVLEFRDQLALQHQ